MIYRLKNHIILSTKDYLDSNTQLNFWMASHVRADESIFREIETEIKYLIGVICWKIISYYLLMNIVKYFLYKDPKVNCI